MHSRVVPIGKFVENDQSTSFPSSIAPLENDVVITKRRVSAFTGTDLEVVLRSSGVDNLVIGGIATSGAVLSTLR